MLRLRIIGQIDLKLKMNKTSPQEQQEKLC